MYTIIDAHCHIYPDKIAVKAAQATGNFYDIGMLCDGKVSTLNELGSKAGISHFIVQSVATAPKQVSSINRFISETVKQNSGKMTGLGTLHPESDDILRDVEELISLGLKGVKLHPDIQGFKIDDFRCLKIYEICEKKHLPILMHTGDSRYDNSNPNRLLPILDIYTDLIIIGAHLGGYSLWDEAVKILQQCPNLYVDTSSSLFALDKKTATDYIRMYGTDKVLFGTDYPMWYPDKEIQRFMNLDLTEQERINILAKNAANLFDISL